MLRVTLQTLSSGVGMIVMIGAIGDVRGGVPLVG